MSPARPIADRIMEKIRVEGECWIWTATTWNGYGKVSYGGTARWAHRVAYETFVGPIPDGYDLDHLCREPSCVNPAHLEPVTHQENVRRGDAGKRSGEQLRARTHCRHGHAYDEANTAWRKDGSRGCKACARAYWHRKKAAA